MLRRAVFCQYGVPRMTSGVRARRALRCVAFSARERLSCAFLSVVTRTLVLDAVSSRRGRGSEAADRERGGDVSPGRVRSETELAALCVALGARATAGWSAAEQALTSGLAAPPATVVAAVRDAIRSGGDPLGASFSALRSPETRRLRGATYTPWPIVRAMVEWARGAIDPARIVDPGCGSGRFLLAAGGSFPRAPLLGVDIDPLAALMARANLAARGLADRAEIRVDDYRRGLPSIAGRTLFIGNPPYVRHHDIDARWKEWLSASARAHGLGASRLAGLHVHFFLASLAHARPGDAGMFITAAEWLDVNYGQLVRELLVGPLGLVRLDLVQPEARAFEDALTTAVIAGFEVGGRSALVRVRRLASPDVGRLAGGRAIARSRLARAPRWTALFRPARRSRGSSDQIELGEICAVHRGQVTGANDVWIAGADTPFLPPACLVPSVTRARELFDAGCVLSSADRLRLVIDLPSDLNALYAQERALVERFVLWARNRGAHASYIARHRDPWWSVKLRAPAPILATYMARRPPGFVRNAAGARHINIAHGIYPREPLAPACLDALTAHLRATVSLSQGRAYAGGLTKFEPREMERLLVPTLAILREMAMREPITA